MRGPFKITPSKLKVASTLTMILAFGSAMSDRFLVLSVQGAHFRVGQLLLAGVGALGWLGSRERTKNLSGWTWLVPLLLLASSLLGPTPTPTLIKAGWLIFNLYLSLSLAGLRDSKYFKVPLALQFAMALLAGVIVFDSYSLYLLQSGFHLGLLQESYPINGVPFFRPHAFYFEPSYAGTALALAGMFFWYFDKTALRISGAVACGFMWSAALLTTSRAAIGAMLLFCLLEGGRLLTKPGVPVLKTKLQGLIPTLALFLLPLLLSPGGNIFYRYFTEKMAVSATVERLQQTTLETASERNRLQSMKDDLAAWREHPWFGNGVASKTHPGDSHTGLLKVAAVSTSIWTEILSEKGIIGGVLALIFIAIMLVQSSGSAIRVFWPALGAHLGFTWFFVQTLPRLDFWLIIFILGSALASEVSSRPQGDTESIH